MKKYLSRKFIACLTGVLAGIGVIVSGSHTEGITAVLVSVLGYIIAEGYIDAKAVGNVIEVLDNTVDGVSEAFDKQVGINND